MNGSDSCLVYGDVVSWRPWFKMSAGSGPNIEYTNQTHVINQERFDGAEKWHEVYKNIDSDVETVTTISLTLG